MNSKKNTEINSLIKNTVIILIILLLLAHILTMGCSIKKGEYIGIEEIEITNETENSFTVIFERIDASIKNDSGSIVAVTYYDKPIITGNSDAIHKINTYFENECQGFFFGKSRINFFGERDHKNFEDRVNESLEREDGLNLEVSHYYNTVDIEIAFLSNEVLSFVENTHYSVGGMSTWYSFGANFSMYTGGLLSLDHFIDIGIDRFREELGTFITNKLFKRDYAHRADEFKMALRNMEYEDFEYYFDGDAVYLLLSHKVISNEYYQVRWDLQTRELTEVWLD